MVTSELPISETEKRTALDEALSSRTFARSAQLKALLRYLCERELAGLSEELTEYQIAVDVLGRRKDFDQTDDASVRNRAYELRQRLEKYYATENQSAPVQISIPRGSYVPCYNRAVALAPAEFTIAATSVHPPNTRRNYAFAAILALACLLSGLAGWYLARPHPSAILQEAWGPLAEPREELLISIATSLHMMVRPHMAEHPWRLPAPPNLEKVYGSNRPLEPGTPLFMEPAQLSVPLAELSAAATLSNQTKAFGARYQILPEAEAPVAALRGRNAMLIASGTHSQAARVLLRNLPFTVDYNSGNRICVLDQRKPAGKNEVFTSQPTGEPVLSTSYGLLSVLTWPEADGSPHRTVVFSGTASAGVQAAVEFFCSPDHMRDLKNRMHGFPPSYQVVVRCKTSGLRLISYEYATHEAVAAH